MHGYKWCKIDSILQLKRNSVETEPDVQKLSRHVLVWYVTAMSLSDKRGREERNVNDVFYHAHGCVAAIAFFSRQYQ
jgi:hypothetical protein